MIIAKIFLTFPGIWANNQAKMNDNIYPTGPTIKEYFNVDKVKDVKIFGNGLNYIDGLETSKVNESIELEDIKYEFYNDNILVNGKIKK